jgi:exopolysaccharide production protein ExoZ
MRPTLHNLQALRGLACLVVVLYHIAGYENTFWTKWRTFHFVRWFGFAGVDVFFALSGFIIAWAHRDQLGQAKHLPRYLVRRFRRIYPVLWAAMLASMALVAVAGTGAIFVPGWRREYFECFLLLPRQEPFRFIAATWSLHYEILFYLAFGLLFLVPKRCAIPLAFGWVFAIAGAWTIPLMPQPYWAQMLLTPYCLEFLGGAGVAALAARGFVRGPRVALGLAFAWTVSVIVLFDTRDPNAVPSSIWGRFLAFGPSSVLIVYAVVAGELTGRIRLSPRLRPLGDASYSIYLIHGPVTLTLVFLMWGLNTNLPTHLVWIAVQLAAGIGAGWLLYRFVERPLLNRKPKDVPRNSQLTSPNSVLNSQSVVNRVLSRDS